MIFKALATGSDGNAYLLESEKAVLIIEAGKGTYKKIIAALPEKKTNVGVIISHLHSDHCGDLPKIKNIAEEITFNENRYDDEFFTIIRFPVWHNIECFGFAIYCKEEGRTMLFITDFAKILEKGIYGLKVDFLAVELSYNEHIRKELSEEQKHGLEYHSSDFHTYAIIRKLSENNKNMKSVTLHKSDRACNYAHTNRELYKRFGLKVEMANIGRGYIF